MKPPGLSLVKSRENGPTPLALDPAILVALAGFREELVRFLKGKDAIVDAMVCSILASGHVLLEDVPGVGKTTVIKALAKLLGLEMKRIQCTSDLLPSDIIGVEVFSSATGTFQFHKGPLFSHIVLVDELNRASPRTQSALLEAMGEGYVTVDRNTYELPKPFVLFAAQNPGDHIGTYPLPESQLDRFSVKVHLDYPSSEKEKEIFSFSTLEPLGMISEAKLTQEQFKSLQAATEMVFISDRVADYASRFVQASRTSASLKRGVSTRGGVTWIRTARGRALLNGRNYVTPDDLLALAPMCLSHRIIPQTGSDAASVISHLQSQVEIG